MWIVNIEKGQNCSNGCFMLMELKNLIKISHRILLENFTPEYILALRPFPFSAIQSLILSMISRIIGPESVRNVEKIVRFKHR